MFSELALNWADFAARNDTAVVATALVATIALVSSGSFVKDNPLEVVARWALAVALASQAWFAYHGETEHLYNSAVFAAWSLVAVVAWFGAAALAGWGRARMARTSATESATTDAPA